MPNFRANRGPIRRLKFPKRRRPAYPIFSSILTGSVAFDGTNTVSNLGDHGDWLYTSASTNASHKIHRITLKGGVGINYAETTAAELDLDFAWAVYITDAEDTDDELWGVTGNVLASKHILAWNTVHRNVREVPSATISNLTTPALPIKFDLKFRRPVLLPPDSFIALNTQFAQAMGNVIAGATFTGLLRVVAQPAEMGR